MLDNLIVVALIVAALWVVILALYLVVSRRQPDVAAQIRDVEAQLAASENADAKH